MDRYKKIAKYSAAAFIVLAFIFSMSSCGVKEMFFPDSSKEIDPLELTFAYPRDGSSVFQKLSMSFNEKNSQIIINGLDNGSAAYHYEGLQSSYASGKGIPDIVLLHDTWYYHFASSDYLMELDEVIPDDKKKEFMPGMVKAVTVNKKLYGLPISQDTILLFYRKDLIKKAPKTWDELMDSANAVSKKNKSIKHKLLLPANNDENMAYFILNMMSSYGSGFKLQSNPVKYKKDNTMDAFDMLYELVNMEIIKSDILGMDPEDCRTIFERGNGVFMLNWSYARKLIGTEDGSPIKGKVGITALPGNNSANKDNIISGWAVSISKDTMYAHEAVKFIEFLTSSEGQLKVAVEGGLLPVKQNLYNQTDWKKAEKVPGELESLIKKGSPMLAGMQPYEQYRALSSAVKQVFRETDNKPKEMFDSMKKGFEALNSNKVDEKEEDNVLS